MFVLLFFSKDQKISRCSFFDLLYVTLGQFFWCYFSYTTEAQEEIRITIGHRCYSDRPRRPHFHHIFGHRFSLADSMLIPIKKQLQKSHLFLRHHQKLANFYGHRLHFNFEERINQPRCMHI